MKQTIYVFIGPPGSGKGSLSQVCAQKRGFVKLSTGELCRKHIKERTQIGQEIDFTIKSGKLIDDSLMIQMVDQWLSQLPQGTRYLIFDGFPRTVAQAEALDGLLQKKFPEAQLQVIEFALSDQKVIDRLASRLVCTNAACQTVYSTALPELAPAKQMVCSVCNSALERRADDQPETIRQRLATYYEHAKPLLAYYRATGHPVTTLNVDTSFAAVYQEFTKLIEPDKHL